MKNDGRIILTLDAGGTNFLFSAIKNGSIIGKPLRFPANASTLDEMLDKIVLGFQSLMDDLNEKVSAISFAFPGPADYEQGIIGDLENLPLSIHQYAQEAQNIFADSNIISTKLFLGLPYLGEGNVETIINKLKAVGGFDKDVAGAVDIAYRPCSGKNYVWDGLRRFIMVGMCGGDRITASLYTHPANLYDDECRKSEARFFKIRN